MTDTKPDLAFAVHMARQHLEGEYSLTVPDVAYLCTTLVYFNGYADRSTDSPFFLLKHQNQQTPLLAWLIDQDYDVVDRRGGRDKTGAFLIPLRNLCGDPVAYVRTHRAEWKAMAVKCANAVLHDRERALALLDKLEAKVAADG